MSSPDAPYKSRLFNFLNRQSLRWGDRLGKALRNLQVAAIWGAQILAYPVYLLAQTGRLLGERLGQKVEAIAGRVEEDPETLATDLPIQRSLASVVLEVKGTISGDRALQQGILRELTAYTVAIKPIEPSPPDLSSPQAEGETTAAIEVRGIACSLETRALVLVAPENQVLDILSPTQQQQLQQRLIWEVASFKHRQRLIASAARPLRISSATERDSRVLLPARWFWKVMRWVQRSPVAIAIDLFGESALAQSSAAHSSRSPQLEDLLGGSGFNEPIAWLDGAIAHLETNPPVPPLALAQWREAVESVVRRLQDKLSPPEQDLTEGKASDARSLQALLQAAIAYFFTPQGKLSTDNPESRTLLSPSARAADPLLPGQDPPALPDAGGEIALNASESDTPSHSQEAGKAETLTLLYLIRAAIDYFFGTRESAAIAENPTHPDRAPDPSFPEKVPVELPEKMPSLQLAPETTPAGAETGDLWLVWEDLYEEIASDRDPELAVEESLTPALSPNPAPTPMAVKRSPFRKISPAVRAARLQRSQHKKRSSLARNAAPKSHPPTSPSQKEITPSSPPANPESPLSVREESALDPASDWIETEATSTGYVKHPLEQLLEWLDKLMLAIENVVLAIWRWIYRRIP